MNIQIKVLKENSKRLLTGNARMYFRGRRPRIDVEIKKPDIAPGVFYYVWRMAHPYEVEIHKGDR